MCFRNFIILFLVDRYLIFIEDGVTLIINNFNALSKQFNNFMCTYDILLILDGWKSYKQENWKRNCSEGFYPWT